MSATEFESRPPLESFPVTWRRVVTDPHGFFEEMPQTGGLGAPGTFLALCGGLNAAGHLLTGWGAWGAIAVFAGHVVGAVVLAALFVLIAQHLFGGRAGFEPTFRVVAYGAAPLVLFWVPLVGKLAWLYGAYLMLRGIERVQALDTTRAVLTVVLGLGAVWLLGSVPAGGPVWF
jgi:hypothetical protein